MINKLVPFDPELLKKIVKAARKSGVSACKFIRDACKEKLEREAQS